MIKRKTTTTYEYNKDGNVIKKTIVEESFEDENKPYQQYPLTNPCKPYDTHEFWWNNPYCDSNTTSGANPNLTTTTTVSNNTEEPPQSVKLLNALKEITSNKN